MLKDILDLTSQDSEEGDKKTGKQIMCNSQKTQPSLLLAGNQKKF